MNRRSNHDLRQRDLLAGEKKKLRHDEGSLGADNLKYSKIVRTHNVM